MSRTTITGSAPSPTSAVGHTAGPTDTEGHWWAKLVRAENDDHNSADWEVVQVFVNTPKPWCEADLEDGECMLALVPGIEQPFKLDRFEGGSPVIASAPTLAATIATLQERLRVAEAALEPFVSLADEVTFKDAGAAALWDAAWKRASTALTQVRGE